MPICYNSYLNCQRRHQALVRSFNYICLIWQSDWKTYFCSTLSYVRFYLILCAWWFWMVGFADAGVTRVKIGIYVLSIPKTFSNCVQFKNNCQLHVSWLNFRERAAIRETLSSWFAVLWKFLKWLVCKAKQHQTCA